MAQYTTPNANDALDGRILGAIGLGAQTGGTNGLADGADRLVLLVEEALCAGRQVRTRLLDTVIPVLPPARRTFADWVVRLADNNAFFDERALRDIEAFLALVEREVASGTKEGWEPDENHGCGGYEVTYRTPDAAVIAEFLPVLQGFRGAIAQTLDAAKAEMIALRLMAG